MSPSPYLRTYFRRRHLLPAASSSPRIPVPRNRCQRGPTLRVPSLPLATMITAWSLSWGGRGSACPVCLCCLPQLQRCRLPRQRQCLSLSPTTPTAASPSCRRCCSSGICLALVHRYAIRGGAYFSSTRLLCLSYCSDSVFSNVLRPSAPP